MNINSLGIDIAKNIFQLHGVDKSGKNVLKKRISRDKIKEYISNLPCCTIIMESCGGSNYWAKTFQKYGHTVKLISPQFVKPFVKTNKNDANDAEAIVEAASRPNMRFVPIKQVEQQDIQSLHRIRSRLVKNKTALINEIRGLLLEYGVTIPLGSKVVRKKLIAIISDFENELTFQTRDFMEDLYDELGEVENNIKKVEKKLILICKNNDSCCRLMSVPGVGLLTATAIVAAVPDTSEFKNGRHMSAWLGLVPRQSSSGDKQILLGISKRGDRYLRTLLIHGARSVLTRCDKMDDDYGRWAANKKTEVNFNKASVALANKNARIIFSLLKDGGEFNATKHRVAA